jgi:DNA-binding Lrp family transcriptional regulator
MPVIGCYDGSGMGQSIEVNSIMDEHIGNSHEPSWFKFHRYWIEDSPVFANAEYFRIFVWLLNRVRHKPGSVALQSGQVVHLDTNECIVGRQAAARALNMSESTFRNRLEKLAELGAITLKKDRSFTRVSVVISSGLKPKKDNPRTRQGQPEDNPRTRQGQPEDTNKTNETDETKKTNHTDERESSGVAAFPPTIEQIESLIDEYIRTISANEKTQELEQEIKALETKAESIKTEALGQVQSGTIVKDSYEYSKAVDEHKRVLGEAETKRIVLGLAMAQDDLNSVQKKDLAREFFNYWDSADWKKNGRLIKLSAEINKWTQREISNKHNPRQAKKNRKPVVDPYANLPKY